MSVCFTRASLEEKAVVARLLQLCLHDHATYRPADVQDDGLFEYPWLDLYWSSTRRYPYLLRSRGSVAGFAFVRGRDDGEQGDWQWQIAEFFIRRSARGRKLGIWFAVELLRSEAGLWELSYDQANTPARHFWTAVVASLDPESRAQSLPRNRERFLVKSMGNEVAKASQPTPGSVTDVRTHAPRKLPSLIPRL